MDDLISRSRLLDFERFDAQIEEHTADDILAMIKTAPPVDAAPVVHGRWITLWPNSGHSRRPTKCSACGAWGRNQEKHKDNYCPSCGARMDLPEGEEAQNDG